MSGKNENQKKITTQNSNVLERLVTKFGCVLKRAQSCHLAQQRTQRLAPRVHGGNQRVS